MTWISQSIETLWNAMTAGRTLAIIIGVAFAILAIGLIIASRKRLGQTKPITVAIVLSILAHIWLLTYAVVVPDVGQPGSPRGESQPMAMSFAASELLEPPPTTDADWSEPSASTSFLPATEPPDWEKQRAFNELAQMSEIAALLAEQPSELEVPPLLEPAPLPPLSPPPLPATKEELVVDESDTSVTELLADASLREGETEQEVAAGDSFGQPADRPQPADDLGSLQSPPVATLPVDAWNAAATPDRVPAAMAASDRSPILPPELQLPPDTALPAEYQLRQAPNRLQLSQAFGADADTEGAVERALAWLARAQASDGSWIAGLHGAGTETLALGEYRHGTGSRADTGLSGLALLAFLSAGHTHREGTYRKVVNDGLSYLLLSQMPSGDLSGAKQVGQAPSVVYARMYCHSIAALALAEAYAMTHDPALQPAVVKAAQYSIRAQDIRGGGWRYRPGDSGDLSQFGWKAMFLRSVERSGIAVPPEVQQRMRLFLDSCAAGEHRGLARYLPKEGRPTATMTAEGLACRLLLDYPHSAQAQAEALHMIIQHLPGTEPDNVYYWYYATLALFQLQDESWRRWNQAMKTRLLATQLPESHPQAGSWDPDSLWGGYGGRVYSTALSCLCLEVYYRYLPMYQHSQLARQNAGELNR